MGLFSFAGTYTWQTTVVSRLSWMYNLLLLEGKVHADTASGCAATPLQHVQIIDDVRGVLCSDLCSPGSCRCADVGCKLTQLDFVQRYLQVTCLHRAHPRHQGKLVRVGRPYSNGDVHVILIYCVLVH